MRLLHLAMCNLRCWQGEEGETREAGQAQAAAPGAQQVCVLEGGGLQGLALAGSCGIAQEAM